MIAVVLSTVARCTTQALRSLLGALITALGGYVIVRGAHGDAVALTNALLGAALMAFGCFLVAPGPTGAGVDFVIDKVRRYQHPGTSDPGGAPDAHGDATAHTDEHPLVATFPTKPL